MPIRNGHPEFALNAQRKIKRGTAPAIGQFASVGRAKAHRLAKRSRQGLRGGKVFNLCHGDFFAHCEKTCKPYFRSLRLDTAGGRAHTFAMNEAGWYLREWREARGLNMEELAHRAETSPGQLSDLEKGKRRYNRDWVRKFSTALSIEEVKIFQHPQVVLRGQRSINVIGKVAAGSEGYFIDDYAMGGGEPLDTLDPSTHIALRIEGDSMVPRFYPGEIVIFGPEAPAMSLVNRECLVDLPDGRKLLKVLRRGSALGLWNLHSVNSSYAPIEDVTIIKACPFVGLRV